LKQKIKKKTIFLKSFKIQKQSLEFLVTGEKILDKETRKRGQRHRCHKIQEAKASF